jgi:uncharacterized membrane protein YkvA (DUF1232 family)
MWWHVLVSVALGLLLVWAGMVLALYVVGRKEDDPTALRDVVRLVPDVVRLLRRLASDPELPRGVRIGLALMLGYLVFPLDLVPDFLPVVGYADDAVIVALALRSVVRRAGPEALDRHWPGTPEGLRALERLVGVERD